MIRPYRMICMLFTISLFTACGVEDVKEINKIENVEELNTSEADAEGSYLGSEGPNQAESESHNNEETSGDGQDLEVQNITGEDAPLENEESLDLAEDSDTEQDSEVEEQEAEVNNFETSGACYIVSRFHEGANETEIQEFFTDNYPESSPDEIAQLLSECDKASADIILIILIKKQTPILDAVRAVLEKTGASIHLVIEVLKAELADSAIPEIVSVLTELGIYTSIQIGEILVASIESGILIAEILYEELKNYADIFLIVVIKLGTPVYDAVKFCLEKAVYTAELAAHVLIELATPVVEVVGILAELFLYTAVQIGEVLAATVKAGLIIADILYQELVDFAEILLVVVIKIGTPIFEAVSFVLEKAVYTAELVCQVLIKIATPVAEIVGVLANLFFFTAIQVAEVLAATVKAGLIIADILYDGLKDFAEICLHVAIKLCATVVIAVQKVIAIVGLTAQLVVKCLAAIGLSVAAIIGTCLKFFALAPLAILGLLSHHTNYHQDEITNGARIALADAGYDVYAVNSTINNFIQSGPQIGFGNSRGPGFGLSVSPQ